jgi:prokaryotic ubiquitin-like protein Pup
MRLNPYFVLLAILVSSTPAFARLVKTRRGDLSFELPNTQDSVRSFSHKRSDVDGTLDEIDDVLETDAEDFVRSFVQKGGKKRADPPSEDVDNSDVKERQGKLSEDVEDVLDEIDDVLESNSEDFVRSYVQKGGQKRADDPSQDNPSQDTDIPGPRERKDQLSDDVDPLLDEVDEELESNAADFISSFG